MEITGLTILVKLLKLLPAFIGVLLFFRRNHKEGNDSLDTATYKKFEFMLVGITVALLLFAPFKMTNDRANLTRNTFERSTAPSTEAFKKSVKQEYTQQKRSTEKQITENNYERKISK